MGERLELPSSQPPPASIRRAIIFTETAMVSAVLVYIWNLTHGGGARRPADEYRIQITGISGPAGVPQFEAETGNKTLILGWWSEADVFAGFDYAFHDDPLGASPSIQIGEVALRAAHANGFAPYNKGNGELAIAFRPDFLGTYVENLADLHASGRFNREIELLDRIAAYPQTVTDAEIVSRTAAPRQFAIRSTRHALRDIDFRKRVLTAYEHRCAMCGLQLKMLDAAHILPVAQQESTDETQNGVSLCASIIARTIGRSSRSTTITRCTTTASWPKN